MTTAPFHSGLSLNYVLSNSFFVRILKCCHDSRKYSNNKNDCITKLVKVKHVDHLWSLNIIFAVTAGETLICAKLKLPLCGGMKENIFHRFIYSNSECPVGKLFGKDWEVGVGSRDLVEGSVSCITGSGFWGFKRHMSFPAPTSLSCDYIDQDMNSQLFLHSAIIDFNPLKLQVKWNTWFYMLPWSWCFMTAIENN